MIRFEQVKKVLGAKTVLDRISFEIERGETLVIVGFSGAGKSVTLRHVVRLLTPDTGKIWVGDDCVSEASGRALERIRSRVGYLFQSGALMQWLTVADNVGLPLREKGGMSEKEVDRRVEKTLDRVNLTDAMDKFPADISGGMCKRAALARAIVAEPEIILYDEPTSGLDPVTSRTIDSLIVGLRRELGVTSVVVTHDLHSALAVGSRIAMLYDGKIVELAVPNVFVHSENDQVQEFLAAQHIDRDKLWGAFEGDKSV